MKKTYSKPPQPVKSCRYPLLWGFRNLLFNSIPFALIWHAADMSVFIAAFGTFLFCLIYGLRENYCRNRRLSQMARQLKEQRNA